MRFTKKSMISGIIRSMDIPMDHATFEKSYSAYKNLKLSIDDAFPTLDKETKEFIQYGTVAYEWEYYNGTDYDIAMAKWKDKDTFGVG